MPQGYELNLRDYWNIFLKRKWVIVFSTLAILVGSIVYTNLQPVLYRATALVKVERIVDRGSPVFGGRPFGSYYGESDNLESYAKQMTSFPVVEQALRSLGMISAEAGKKQIYQEVGTTAAGLSATPQKESRMIRVTMTSEDPYQAAVIANEVAQSFKSENMRIKNKQVRNVREFIEQQLARIEPQLRADEEELRELTIKGVGSTAASITQTIGELELERANLLANFTEAHPDALKINEQMDHLKEQLKGLPKEEFEYSILARDIKINENLYNLLRQKLQEAQIKESEKIDNVLIISPAVPPRHPFHPNKKTNYFIGLIVGVIFGISTGLMFEHMDTSIGKIEDLENITKISVIGVIPFFAARDIELKEKFKRPSLFFASRETRENRMDKLRSQLIATHSGSSIFLEAFRILGANVQVIFGKGERIKNKCILITSSNPQEGKSIISSNLGVIMAQMGYKTVVVDTDLRRSTVHKVFGLKEKSKGLTDVLTGERSLEACTRVTTDLLLGDIGQDELLKNPWMDNFNLITAGTTFPNSSYLFNTEKMDKFIKDLKDKYDVVILDSSPVLAVSDTSIIVPKTDGVILIYRAGTTSRLSLRRAQMQIETVRSKGVLKGVVLNNVTPEVSVDTYYYYYRGKYYREKEDGKEGKA
ncbi:GumC family protein [Candidatus Omnitrophota bacterium]